MKEAQFILVTIDYKMESYEDPKFIPLLLEKLRLDVYKNKSILISKHTLLVNMNHDDLNVYYLHPKYHIDNIFCEIQEKEGYLSVEQNDLNIYCFPIAVENFEDELSSFSKEIEYLNSK